MTQATFFKFHAAASTSGQTQLGYSIYVLIKAWVRVHYWIYQHELLTNLLKIEHKAEGRVPCL